MIAFPVSFPIALSALAIVTATAADTVRCPFKLDLKQPGGITTAVGFVRQGPPPWLDGNCLVIGKWAVLNMHTENMGAFRAKFQMDELDEELNLVPHEWMTWDAGGKGWSMLHGEDHKSRVIYRRVTQPKTP